MMEFDEIKELYELYGYAVHRRCLRILGDASAADDALQEVFMRVLKYRKGFRGGNQLAWLYRIADRCCLDFFKRNHRLVFKPSEQLPEPVGGTAVGEKEDRIRTIINALRHFRKGVQEVVLLYYLDGMTQEEVAEAAGCSRKTVKKRLAVFKRDAAQLLETESKA